MFGQYILKISKKTFKKKEKVSDLCKRIKIRGSKIVMD